jgi:hypothetical protein
MINWGSLILLSSSTNARKGMYDSPEMEDVHFRREVYLDWEEVLDYLGRRGIDQFCRCKGITIDQLIEIINEFIHD